MGTTAFDEDWFAPTGDRGVNCKSSNDISAQAMEAVVRAVFVRGPDRVSGAAGSGRDRGRGEVPKRGESDGDARGEPDGDARASETAASVFLGVGVGGHSGGARVRARAAAEGTLGAKIRDHERRHRALNLFRQRMRCARHL